MNRRYGMALILFGIALLVRLLYVLEPKPPLASDMKDYAVCAENFLSGQGLIMSEKYQAYRPPLYPLLLAAQFRLAGGYSAGLVLARIVQAVLGATVAAMVYLLVLSANAGGRRDPAMLTAIVAGLLVSFFDSLVFYCGEILTEGWYIPAFTLLSLLVFRLVSGSGAQSASGMNLRAAGMGILLGLTALLRPAALSLLPVVLIAVAYRSRKVLTPLITFAAAVIVIAPWTIRNAVRLHAFVPISTNTGVNLHIGHNPDFGYDRYGYKEDVRSGRIEPVIKRLNYKGPIPDYPMNEVEENRFFTRLACHYVKTHPGATIKNSFLKVAHLYRFPKRGEGGIHYKPWPWPAGDGILSFEWIGKVPLAGWSPLLALLVLGGIVLSIREWRTWWPLYLVIGFHTFTYVVFFGTSRFLVSEIPILCVFAAYLIGRVYGWAFQRA